MQVHSHRRSEMSVLFFPQVCIKITMLEHLGDVASYKINLQWVLSTYV